MTASVVTVLKARDAATLTTLVTAGIAASTYPIGNPFVDQRAADGKRLCQLMNTQAGTPSTAYEIVGAFSPDALATAVQTALNASWLQFGDPIVVLDGDKEKFLQAFNKTS